MDNTEELTHLSLCAGYGGIDLGLKRAIPSLRTIAFSEIEAYACSNLVTKIEAGLLDAAPIWTDLKTFPWESFYGKVDIISGGFPCQPFSTAGKRKGDEDPRHLFPYIKRGIELVRPTLVFFENVQGIISSKLTASKEDEEGTPVLLHVLRELERLGYRATAGIFSADEIGAPHQRKRVFILGYRSGRNEQRTGGRGRSIKERMAVSIREPSANIFPSRRGEEQKLWEPSRVTSNSHSNRAQVPIKENESIKSKSKRSTQGEIKPPLGRGSNGYSDRLDYGDLCESLCNRTDELRLLGNGVLPATAERAFRTLWEKLGNAYDLPTTT